MKPLLICETTLDQPNNKIVQVPDDHPAITYCEKWAESSQSAPWIDPCSDDEDEEDNAILGALLDDMKPSDLKLPCQIDHVIHVLSY